MDALTRLMLRPVPASYSEQSFSYARHQCPIPVTFRQFTRVRACMEARVTGRPFWTGRRGSYRLRGEPDPIDLGNEPPLSVDGETHGVIDRRRISAQWFSGTILTGLCGAALMGGAVFTSLDGEAHFAALPERVESALRGAIGDRLVRRAQGRPLPPAGETNAARQVIRVSMTSRVGNREVVRVRPFVRVSANLSLSVSELSANIPPFNPQKTPVANAPPTARNPDEPAAAAEPDAEVSFVHARSRPRCCRA